MKFRDLPDSNEGSKSFLKLKDKESATGIFRGEIHEFYAAWDGSKYKEVPEGTQGGSFRFRINFVVKEESNFVPKIFENGKGVYRQLAELHSEYDLQETVVKITRSGTETETTYTIMPLPPKMQMSKETKAFVDKIELLPLTAKQSNAAYVDSNGDSIQF